MYKITKINNGLVTWLREHGADKDIVYDFYLSKGMGERLELRIMNNDVTEITFYGTDANEAGEPKPVVCGLCGHSGRLLKDGTCSVCICKCDFGEPKPDLVHLVDDEHSPPCPWPGCGCGAAPLQPVDDEKVRTLIEAAREIPHHVDCVSLVVYAHRCDCFLRPLVDALAPFESVRIPAIRDEKLEDQNSG